jgi:hypothetical protein
MKDISNRQQQLRKKVMDIVKESGLPIEQSDTNYIFIRFVMDHMPRGLIGLLIAVIFLAAWGSIAATLIFIKYISMPILLLMKSLVYLECILFYGEFFVLFLLSLQPTSAV